MSMFIEILNGITVTLGHLLFGFTLHSINCFLVVKRVAVYRFVGAVASSYFDVTILH